MIIKKVYYIAVTNPNYTLDILTGLLTIIC
jgi:hypothetical protein